MPADLRHALRALRRRPGFAAVAALTLAVAIGANVTLFSVVNGVLLRPLPFSRADQLVGVWLTYPHWQEREVLSRFWDRIPLSYPEYERLRDGTTAFEAVGLFRADEATIQWADGPEMITVGAGDHALPAVLGVQPALGRWFDPTEAAPGGAPVAVLRWGLWRERFGGDSAILGTTVRLDGQPYAVIGVLPPAFERSGWGDLATSDVWIPAGGLGEVADQGSHIFRAVARRKRDVSLVAAELETATLLRGDAAPEFRGARLVGLKEEAVGSARPALLLLSGGGALLLLIGCVNLATLFMGRGVEHEREMAVRLALGAGRGRIARQMLVESLVLVLAGGGLGVLVAVWAVSAMVPLLPADLPRLIGITVDVPVLAFSVGMTLFTGLLFGVGPALRTAHRTRLSEVGRSVTARQRLPATLVATQVALALVLLVGAGFLTRTLVSLSRLDPGFRQDGLLTFGLVLPDARYPSADAQQVFYQELNARLAALPGVHGVATTSVLPLSGASASNSAWIASWGAETGSKPEVQRRIVSPDYFRVADVRLLRGRLFDASGHGDGEGVMLVSQHAANRLWGGADPIGDRVEVNERWWTVIGVVEDVRDQLLGVEIESTVYVPFAQWPTPARSIVVHVGGDPSTLGGPVREVVADLDPAVAVRDLGTMRELAARSIAGERLRAVLIAGFASVAVLLAAIGTFGVTAHAVARSTRELGIRIALGAEPAMVRHLVLGRVARMVGAGFVVGTALALPLPRLLADFLFAAPAIDFVSYGGAAAALAVPTFVAGLVPARRAARIDPMDALRRE